MVTLTGELENMAVGFFWGVGVGLVLLILLFCFDSRGQYEWYL